jgi:hypothetical protein
MLAKASHAMIDVVGRVEGGPEVIVGVEVGEVDAVGGLVDDRSLRHKAVLLAFWSYTEAGIEKGSVVL